jgi:transposase-like protein
MACMAWLFSREEKEQYVIQLYKENRSIRDIAKLMYVSFRRIIHKVKAEAERKAEHTYEQEIDNN